MIDGKAIIAFEIDFGRFRQNDFVLYKTAKKSHKKRRKTT
jgi:hypothetical protein